LKLERFAYLPNGTLGRIILSGKEIFTLERPWLDNTPSISCIPEGVYKVKPDEEGRYTGYPELQDVPGRSEIIIHTANHVHQLEGCIAPGFQWSVSNLTPSVWQSKLALDLIRAVGEEFTLEITSISAKI